MTGMTLLTAADAAKQLGVNTRSLARWAADGRIKSIRLPSGHRRYPLSEIERLRAGLCEPEDVA